MSNDEPSKRDAIVNCIRCAGTGRMDESSGPQRTADNRCPTCDGKGVVWIL